MERSVYSATFVFEVNRYDDDFEHLNALIDHAARTNKGFIGKDSWRSHQGDRQSVVYYWDSMEALKKFSKHPDHQKAKQHYRRWYRGYEVIIAKVLTYRSDGGIEHSWVDDIGGR